MVGVVCPVADLFPQASSLAGRLGCELLPGADPAQLPADRIVLSLDRKGLALQATGRNAPGPVRVDFLGGKANYRRRHGGGRGQLIARAVGMTAARQALAVLDLTAGLGQDAFVLASLGCRLVMVERSPVVWELLNDGLNRAREASELAAVMTRLELIQAEAHDCLAKLDWRPDVIYLDPMFPHRDKSALVKKEMRLFRQLVGDDNDAETLLPLALDKAVHRVVVKRPRHAPPLAGPEPNHRLEGKSSRFDLYTHRRIR